MTETMKHFKLRTDLTIKVGLKTLYRIEATKEITKFGVKVGDLGGYIEKEENLYGDAWVSCDAKVYGDAKVSGDANVSGNAEVYGDTIEKENDLVNITSNAGSYNITITPNHIKIGCQYHSKTAWFKITQNKIPSPTPFHPQKSSISNNQIIQKSPSHRTHQNSHRKFKHHQTSIQKFIITYPKLFAISSPTQIEKYIT